jgi:hypothetical protein
METETATLSSTRLVEPNTQTTTLNSPSPRTMSQAPICDDVGVTRR